MSMWTVYAQGLFGGLFWGYVNGISSVVGYNFGRKDKEMLSGLFRIVLTSFPMLAYNVFGSGWVTALNDGKTSAILSFCRTVIFMVIPVLILPRILGIDGVWLLITAGEALSILMVIYYFIKYQETWKCRSQNAEMAEGLPIRSANGISDEKLNQMLEEWLGEIQ